MLQHAAADTGTGACEMYMPRESTSALRSTPVSEAAMLEPSGAA